MLNEIHCFAQFHSAKTCEIYNIEECKQSVISLHHYTKFYFVLGVKHGVITCYAIAMGQIIIKVVPE